MGTDTEFGQPDYCPAGATEAPVGRCKPAVAPRYGDRHDVRYTDQERLTSNVQLSTFNGVTERGLVVGIWGQTRNLGDRTLDPVDLAKRRVERSKPAGRADMGTDTMSDIPIKNVQRETFNSQLLTG